MLGYWLKEVDPKGAWAKLGFRNDILTTVDDQSLAHADGLTMILDLCGRSGSEVRFLRPRD